MLSVGSDGDAIIWDLGANNIGKSLQRVSHVDRNIKWKLAPENQNAVPGFVIGPPLDRGNGTVVVPLWNNLIGSNSASILVGVLDYSTGAWVSDFTLVDDGFRIDGATPPVAFDPGGTLLYVATQLPSGTSYIRACIIGNTTTEQGRCSNAANRRWTSADLTGQMALLLPFASGSRIAAIAAQQLWFLDAATGGVVNKDGRPLTPDGALVARIALPGPGSSFYLFTSGAPSDTQPIPYPLEIIATDGPDKGEVYRYQVPGGHLAGALDDGGTLWLRVGRKLVKTLSLRQYREAPR
jgi:hypothetical protein